MTEPRARAARHKGQLNFEAELRQFLYAFGDDRHPLPETVRVLDEIVTDYIIETCHSSARTAQISNRQKIKVDDFKFAIRNDEIGSGRVKELLSVDKELKDSRKQFDTGEGKVGLERGGRGRKKKDVAAADVVDPDSVSVGGETPGDSGPADVVPPKGAMTKGDVGEDDVDVDMEGE